MSFTPKEKDSKKLAIDHWKYIFDPTEEISVDRYSIDDTFDRAVFKIDVARTVVHRDDIDLLML